MICQDIKCPDYLTDDGEPAWCYRVGQPAEVAAGKCPKATGEKPEEAAKRRTPNDKRK
jgi:hypothetical protein